jgi:deoxyribonuclease-4
MPLFGAHMSAAGGAFKALLAARDLGMETVQLFSKNNNQWTGKPLTNEDIRVFRQTLRETGLKYPTAHDSYLINLASPDPALWQKSVDAFVDEVDRADALGIEYLVTHPGAHVGAGEETGLANVVRALDEVHARRPEAKVRTLLEVTAGQGTSLGHRFEHLAAILDRVRDPVRLGVCFDTCHAIAAGYPLFPEPDYRRTFDEFDRLIGLDRLKVFHMNDSKKPLGSRVDRHEHIGLGHVGLEAFRLIVNDPRFHGHPMILETPKHDADGREMDPVNLSVLRSLVNCRGPIR